MATFEDFAQLDIRVGEVKEVLDFPEANKPSYIMKIDFGDEIGVKTSAGQYVTEYSKKELKGKKVLGIINFPPRQMGPVTSEVLILGVPSLKKEAVLITPDKEVSIGGKLY